MNSKWYSKGRLGRISIAWLLSVMMMVTFVPTFAFATPSDNEGETQEEQTVEMQGSQEQNAGEQNKQVEEPASAEAGESDEVVEAKGDGEEGDGEIEDDGNEDEIWLSEITFSKATDLDWTWAFPVANNEATLGLENMGLVVKDENGDVVDSDKYELTFERTWWDDEEETNQSETVDPPLGIVGDDGFTEYCVTATALEGSGYGYSVEADFCIMDQYSLNWICCDEDFAPLRQVGDLQRYHCWRGAVDSLPDSPIVKNSAKGEELTPEEDYTVEYYVRTEEIDEEGDSVPVAGELVTDDDENPCKPTEAGAYIAKIEGDGDYYGISEVAIDLNGYDDIWIDEKEEGAFWSDNTKEYKVTVPVIEDGVFALTVGIQDYDEEEDQDIWVLKFSEADGDYTYNNETNTLTLNGSKLYEKLKAENQPTDDCNITIYACIKVGDEIQSEGLETVWMHESIVDDEMDKDWQINGNHILPGGDGWIKREYN